MEKIYIIIHFTLCFFVDLENFGHEKEAEEEKEDATLEDVVEFTEDTGPRSGTLMNISKKKIQTRFSLNSVINFKNYKNDKVYQLLAHGLWFCPGTRASSDTKTGPIFGLLSPLSKIINDLPTRLGKQIVCIQIPILLIRSP
jgi:hypothetical protein